MFFARKNKPWSIVPSFLTACPILGNHIFYVLLALVSGCFGFAVILCPTCVRPGSYGPVVSRFNNGKLLPSYVGGTFIEFVASYILYVLQQLDVSSVLQQLVACV